MYLEVIIAGFGGQGVMLMGETICEAATSMGVNATFSHLMDLKQEVEPQIVM